MIERVHAERGRIDVLVNNAGLQSIAPVEKFPHEKRNLLIDVMLTGPFLMIQHAVPIMNKQRYGRIINICRFTAGRLLPSNPPVFGAQPAEGSAGAGGIGEEERS